MKSIYWRLAPAAPASKIGATNILVIPEMYGPELAAAYGRRIKKVVLNQNCYLTCRGYAFNRDGTVINNQSGNGQLLSLTCHKNAVISNYYV